MAHIAESFKRSCGLHAEMFVTALVDSIPHPLMVRDAEYRIVLANKAADKYFGAELLGLKCSPGQRNRACVCLDCPAIESATTGKPAKREVRHPQTGDYIEVNTYPMVAGEGQFRGIIETTEIVNEAHGAMEKIRALLSQLSAQNRELTEWRKGVDLELSVAWEIQKSLVPQVPFSHRSVCVDFLYQPSGKIGGDLYDVFVLDEDRVGILIADASGHGMGAAFIAVLIKMVFLSQGTNKDSPKIALEKLNQELVRIVPSGQFATAFYAVLNTKTSKMVFTRAGHPKPMLLRQGANKVEALDTDGFVLGALKDVVLEERSAEFRPGDVLLLYTDGVVDAANEKERRYGARRLRQFFLENRQAGRSELLQMVLSDVRAFAGERPIADDLTLVVVEAT
jgi:serine phosphatase RsbU (regulator of sigma subunit)